MPQCYLASEVQTSSHECLCLYFFVEKSGVSKSVSVWLEPDLCSCIRSITSCALAARRSGNLAEDVRVPSSVTELLDMILCSKVVISLNESILISKYYFVGGTELQQPCLLWTAMSLWKIKHAEDVRTSHPGCWQQPSLSSTACEEEMRRKTG